MKTTNFKTIIIVTLCALAFSCKKKETANPDVNPMQAYLSATGFDQDTIIRTNVGYSEFGLSFKPLVNGKITALVVKIPDTNASLRLTFWNKSTATALKAEILNYSTANKEVVTAISPINVVVGTEYMVTVNSDDIYDYRRNNGSAVTYPITVGDISVTGYAYNLGTTQTLPNQYETNYFGGDISFKFQKD